MIVLTIERLRVAALVSVCATLWAGGNHGANAQDIEPRSYSNAPVGVNFLIAGYAYTRGGIAFDSALPIENEHLTTSSAVFAYARVLDFWGLSGKFDMVVPVTSLSGSADYLGQPIARAITSISSPSPGNTAGAAGSRHLESLHDANTRHA
jgi:hypothetical protein